MAFDYTEFVELADEMINEFGRPIVFETATFKPFVDPLKPWKGRDLSSADADLFPAVGVFVPPNQVRIFGLSALGDATQFNDTLQMSEQMIIVKIPQVSNVFVDLRIFTVVTDKNQEWQITATQQLQPGDTPIIGYVGVRR